MDVQGLLMSFGSHVLGATPFYITMGVGAVLALVTWKRHRKASALAFLGFSLMVVLQVISSLIYATLPFLYQRQGWESSTLGTVYTATGIVTQLIDVLPWTLLMMAIFIRRQPPPATGLSP